MNYKNYLLRLPIEIHTKLKILCAEKGISMQKFIEKLIKEKV